MFASRKRRFTESVWIDCYCNRCFVHNELIWRFAFVTLGLFRLFLCPYLCGRSSASLLFQKFFDFEHVLGHLIGLFLLFPWFVFRQNSFFWLRMISLASSSVLFLNFFARRVNFYQIWYHYCIINISRCSVGRSWFVSDMAELDAWDLLEPVDVLSKLPPTFMEGVESKKWQERRDALQTLLTLCTDNPRLCPKASYGEHVNILKRVNLFGLIQMLK